ncbi:SDR family NAD(P)-dependent oxidoreductase [Martelella mediterranea]|uniref:NAD(P)-dependent dehydrogenase (Short-subunit alcohol dehydrogenase family) n=1 Tax=Martelella mediterranea TaxID=293089 RepID=A0A4R3NV64_9HYPH|nr:SDR family NAD(P)-dependent oxidoreductase [Martelella mediterranea]TCT37652.1 NAD(P)-dependent dehydrogenase (short-subunit alcohol dehydrogenase family) [Martelella mediterranea]
MNINHPAIKPGKTAVITGGASGIGYAAAKRFAELGMNVVIADLKGEKLNRAEQSLQSVANEKDGLIVACPTDVSDLSSLEELERMASQTFGNVHVLMNNAGVQPGSSVFGKQFNWQRIIDVNLWGIINGTRLFGPEMIAHGEPAVIINTGSKQGITTPPGDPAYNVSKAGVKAFTEALQHDLRNREKCQVSAHLFVPGFVFTPLTSGDRTEKPDGAWTPEQTVDFMLERLDAGDFYILCPDGEVDRATDEKRIAWAAGDIVENRPPLSRWHPDYYHAFTRFLAGTPEFPEKEAEKADEKKAKKS